MASVTCGSMMWWVDFVFRNMTRLLLMQRRADSSSGSVLYCNDVASESQRSSPGAHASQYRFESRWSSPYEKDQTSNMPHCFDLVGFNVRLRWDNMCVYMM